MHIYEGILAGTAHGREILAACWAASAAGTSIGLYRLDAQRIPQTAVLTSAFFVLSAIHVPLGPTAEHLTLNGLMGLVLGWGAFPAVLVALTLQAMFFSLGGPTVLGLNTLIMALPAVVCYYLFIPLVRARRESAVFAAGFMAGTMGIVLGGLMSGGSLFLAGKGFEWFGAAVAVAHLPVAVVEGLVTGSVVVLVRKVRPELLGAEPLAVVGSEVTNV
jgi:cobalt/nickel transport system permease protein